MPPVENVWRRGVPLAALACALLLQAAAVRADEPRRAGNAVPDPAATSVDTDQRAGNTDQPSDDKGQPSVKSGQPATARASEAAPPVCFKLTQHCIDAQPQGAADAAQHEQATR